MDEKNVMQSILDSVDISARITALRTLVYNKMELSIYDMENLSASDHISQKMLAAENARNMYKLWIILRTFDKEYSLNSMEKDADDHLKTLLSFMR